VSGVPRAGTVRQFGPWLVHAPWLRSGGEGPRLIHGTLKPPTPTAADRPDLAQSLPFIEAALTRLLSEEDPGGWTLLAADQVHGDRIAVFDSPEATQPSGVESRVTSIDAGRISRLIELAGVDAFVCAVPSVFLAIKSADCVPILFWEPIRRVIGACHCGWRGLLAGLGLKTAEAMAHLGASPRRLEAWIGPAIRVEDYEVGPELVERFGRRFPRAAVSPDGRRLDLIAVAREQLRQAGLESDHVADSGLSTHAEPSLPSYRRDGEAAGRLITIIGMLDL